MNIEEKVKTNLLVRGFDNKAQLNNRGLIGATIDETILEVVKNLPLANVIHWVSVKDAQPARRDLAYLTYDELGFMTWRYWKDTFWEGEHIVNEPKVTHWAIVQPPCV